MNDFTFDIQIDGVIAKLGATVDEIRHRAAGGLYSAGENIMANAKEIVPLDEGPLQASGHVQLPEVLSDGTIEVALGFGGAARAYARVQHDNLTYRHAPGRQAHYLSDPIEAAKTWLPGYVQDVAKGDL